MAAKHNRELTETDIFICKEFFSGKSVGVISRDYAIVHQCSRGEADEIVYNALNDFAFDYSLNFS